MKMYLHRAILEALPAHIPFVAVEREYKKKLIK
jgi:hypothetical protein